MIGRISIFILLSNGAVERVVAADAPSAPPAASVCAACHGAHGEGNQALGAPRIAGQDAAYLARQLANFSSGRRGNDPEDLAGATMRAAAAGLIESDMRSLATYYSKLRIPGPATRTASQADLRAGEALYVGTCAACHGPQAQGYPQLQAPNLRILGGWYIASQIESFVKGWRGDAGRSDQQAMWMRSVATHISRPKDLADVVAYIGSLPPPAR